MKPSNRHLIIVAGEASGDMHAARLVEEIKRLNPGVTFSGLGGQKMQAAGVKLYADLTRIAVVGFIEIFKHYKEFKKIFALVLEKVRETEADAVILVDYPGFNLRLAKELKKTGVAVIYYISPQVWAWRQNRVKTIKAFTDKMLVLFDFERKFYARHGLRVDFVGHPLVDAVREDHEYDTTVFLESIGLSKDKLTIGILPGSRQKEIDTILPVMLDAAVILRRDNPDIQFVLIKAPTIPSERIEVFTKNSSVPVRTIEQNIYHGIDACDLCIVTSGTATLETAILNKPMVVVYKTSLLTWSLARLLIRIPYIGLVNVVAGKKIVPECIQFEATGQDIAREITGIYTNKARISRIKEDLECVKHALGPAGASQKAAKEVLKVIN